MVANITVAILAVIAVGSGVFGWWLTNHNDDETDNSDNPKK